MAPPFELAPCIWTEFQKAHNAHSWQWAGSRLASFSSVSFFPFLFSRQAANLPSLSLSQGAYQAKPGQEIGGNVTKEHVFSNTLTQFVNLDPIFVSSNSLRKNAVVIDRTYATTRGVLQIAG
jgi:hypothetical protein